MKTNNKGTEIFLMHQVYSHDYPQNSFRIKYKTKEWSLTLLLIMRYLHLLYDFNFRQLK